MGYLKTFWDETKKHENLYFPYLPDSGPVSLPHKDCSIEIVIYQQNPELEPGAKRYNIRSELWDLLDDYSKAALVLHEIIYREARMHKHKTSRMVRFYTMLMFSKDLESFSQEQYEEYLRKYIRLPIHSK